MVCCVHVRNIISVDLAYTYVLMTSSSFTLIILKEKTFFFFFTFDWQLICSMMTLNNLTGVS